MNNLVKISLKELLASEAYIGEHKRNRNPKNSGNLIAVRNDIDIIDLQKTLTNIEPLLKLVTEVISNYEQILVIAQHPSASTIDFPQPLLTDKWIHGAFSNFKTIKQSKKKNFFSKLDRLPSLVILLHTPNSQIILNETKLLEIPTIGFVDSSDDPTPYYYAIPSNNKSDAVIKLYLNLIKKAIFFGYAKRIYKFHNKVV